MCFVKEFAAKKLPFSTRRGVLFVTASYYRASEIEASNSISISANS